MTNQVKGIEVLLKINTGTDEIPVYTVLEDQKDCELKMTGSEIDTSTKSNAGWDTSVTGNRKWSISGGAIVDTDATAQAALEAAFLAGETIKVQITEDGINKYEGSVAIADHSKSAPVAGMSELSLTLNGSTALAKSTV